MKKRIISLILTVAVLCSLAVPVMAAKVDAFTDVNSSHWFYDSVKFVTEKGMVNGTSATTFGPLVTMTRSQFITILGRMDGVVDEDVHPVSGFTDVPSNEYYTTHVNWAKASGILDVTGSSFRPLADITREEMAIIVGKYIEYKAVPIPNDPNAPAKYNDADTISSAAQPYTELLRKTGVLVGDNFGNMNPKNIMSRSEGVTVFMRIYQKLEAAGVVLTDGLDWFKTAQSEFTISVDDKDVGMYDFLSQAARDKITASGYHLSISSISDRSILNTKNNLFVPLKAGTVTVTYLCNTFGPEGILYVTTTVTISASATVFPDSISASVSWEDAISRGIIKPEQYREKFIYKNNYSGVILRNKAVISFPAPDLTAFILDTRFRLCVHAGRGLDGPVRFAPLGGFFHGDTKTATINCIEGKYANAENQSP